MPDKAWKLVRTHSCWPYAYFFGLQFWCRPGRGEYTELGVSLDFGTHTWDVALKRESKRTCLTKPGKPSSAG